MKGFDAENVFAGCILLIVSTTMPYLKHWSIMQLFSCVHYMCSSRPDVFEYNKRRPRDSLAYVDDTFLPPSDSDDDELAFRVVNANKADVDSDSDCTDGGNKECDFDDCDVNIAACRNALSDECRVTGERSLDRNLR